MDKSNYSPFVKAITFSVMSFGWAAKASNSLPEILISTVSGLIRGVIIVLLEGKFPVYVGRFLAIIPGAAVILIGEKLFNGYNSGIMGVINYIIPPFAAGAMLIEGLSICTTDLGKKKVADSIKIALALRLGVFCVITARKLMPGLFDTFSFKTAQSSKSSAVAIPGLLNILRNAFFSGVVCVGYGITLKNVESHKLWPIFVGAFVCGGFSTVMNAFSAYFIGRFAGAVLTVLTVAIFLKERGTDLMPYIISSIYCIAPGGDMYRMFLSAFNGDWTAYVEGLELILKVSVASARGIIVAHDILKKTSLKNAKENSEVTEV